MCDTYLSARELIRETNYDLAELARTQLGQDRQAFDLAMLPNFFKRSAADVCSVVEHTEKDAHLTLELLFKLNIVPLTKQLTNIAGNLWYRSLQNARAERNELLLVHAYHKEKFICPDKIHTRNEDNDGKRKKGSYEGGLVLEPEPGLYDKIILLLDFNSLYPSIIQEYNLCFTTVKRMPNRNFDGTHIQHLDESGNEYVEESAVPDKAIHKKTAILPSILKMLVDKRRTVK